MSAAANDFVKPVRYTVKDKDYIKNLLRVSLQKDLHGDEELCQRCHGTGMIVVNNVYGLKDDPMKEPLFHYKHQSISFCPSCYNGVVHRCKYCGKILPREMLKCTCLCQKNIDAAEKREKQQRAFDKAPLASKEIENATECFYSDYYGRNEGYFTDWDEFFEYWFENCESDFERPLYVWSTSPVEISIDADPIIESATDDLYEDAIFDIPSEKRKELQDYLDEWCKTCGVGKTYYESHEYKIRIPWELMPSKYEES